VEVCIATSERRHRCGRTTDKVIANDIGI
jgi:hypothetical protein